jgi:outer membrane lipoprotein-sorting protein
MKSSSSSQQGANSPASAQRIACALYLLPLVLLVNGCYSGHVRTVKKIALAPNAMNATLEQLEVGVDAQYAAIHTLNAGVDITATTGGQHEGKEKENPTFSGYMFLRKPYDLRVLLLVPVLRSRALDMVSDGKTFKLIIPSKNRAIEGSEMMTTPSKNGLENLRPSIIRDALLIPAIGPEDYVSVTEDSRILPAGPKRKEPLEEPDYDLSVFGVKNDHVLKLKRIIHIGRVSLRPYRQDLYDDSGRIVTTVEYANYKNAGEIPYPMSITLIRPMDEYTLKIIVTKLTLNQKLDDEQFVLKIPPGMTVQHMP